MRCDDGGWFSKFLPLSGPAYNEGDTAVCAENGKLEISFAKEDDIAQIEGVCWL